MPTVVAEIPYRPVPIEPDRKRWTREDCAAMASSGVWDFQPFELIDGEVINKMGKNWPHSVVTQYLFLLLTPFFPRGCVIQEASLDVSPEDNPTNEPQPDIMVLARPSGEYIGSKPGPSDVLLVAEISDTSLGFDLTRKAALYARAGIRDYWVVDIASRKIVVHREPSHGSYLSIAAYADHESITPLAAPGRSFPVADAFPGFGLA